MYNVEDDSVCSCTKSSRLSLLDDGTRRLTERKATCRIVATESYCRSIRESRRQSPNLLEVLAWRLTDVESSSVHDVYIYEQTANRPCPTPWTGRIGQQGGLRIGMRCLAGSGPTCAVKSADCWTCCALVQLAPPRPENPFFLRAIISALLVSKQTVFITRREPRSACRNWLEWLLCENHNNQQTSNWHLLSPPSTLGIAVNSSPDFGRSQIAPASDLCYAA